MKRREFLIGTAGVLGSSVPGLAGVSARPCPPSALGVQGGTQVTANCSSLTAEQDWLNRSTASAVVWAHDFRLRAEVDNFRSSQDAVDPTGQLVKQGKSTDKSGTGYHTCVWGSESIPGTSGRSLLTYAPKAFGAGKYFSNENAYSKAVDLTNVEIYSEKGAPPTRLTDSQLCHFEMIAGGSWNRVFSPLTYTDGSLPPDVAANGTIPRANWNPNDVYQLGYWSDDPKGFFVNPDYATQQQYASGHVIGNEFWLQYRVKLSADRHAPRQDVSGLTADFVAANPSYPNSYGKQFPPAGKLAMIHKTRGAEQEIVQISGASSREYWHPNTFPFRWYSKYGGMFAEVPLRGNPSISTIQPSSPWELTCLRETQTDLTKPNVCWFWPEDEWVTVLLHIKPGHQNATVDGGNNDTLVEFKVARWGETNYTTIYRANRGMVFSTDSDPLGYALLSLNCYFNNVPSFRYISHTYTQVILSLQEIGCPQIY